MQVGSTTSAFQTGVEGVKQANENAEQAALKISQLNQSQQQQSVVANNEQPPRDIEQERVSAPAELVNLAVSEHQAKANIKTIQTADDMIGTLIDTKV